MATAETMDHLRLRQAPRGTTARMVLPSVEEAAPEGPARAALQATAVVRWTREARCSWPAPVSKAFESPALAFAAAHQLATAVSLPPLGSVAPCPDRLLLATDAIEWPDTQTESPAHSVRLSKAERLFPTIERLLFRCQKAESLRSNQNAYFQQIL